MKKNQKKILTTTVALGAAVAAGAVSTTNVHADAKADNNTQAAQQNVNANQTVGERQNEAAKAQDQFNQASATKQAADQKANTAKSKLDQANQNLNNAQNNVTTQNTAVKNAENDQATAQKNVTDAQNAVNAAQKNVDSTPSAGQVQQSINDQKAKVTSDDQAVDSATQAEQAAQKNVNNAQTAVNDAQGNVDTQTKNVNDAQKNLANVSGGHDTTADAQKAYDDATAKVNNDQDAVKNAQTKVSNATTAKKNADSALADAQKSETPAQNDYNSKNDAASKAQKAYNDAQAATKDAQSKVDSLSGSHTEVNNTITLPAGYKEAFNAYEKAMIDPSVDNATIKELSQKLRNVARAGLSSNSYQDQKADESEKVDYKNLTDAQKKELSMFAAHLVNQVRAQMGANKVIVSPASVAEATTVVKKGYNDPSWDVFGNHLTDGKGHNKSFISSQSINMVENVEASLQSFQSSDHGWVKAPIANNLTMNDLKKAVYNDTVAFLFADAGSAWGHANNIISSETILGSDTRVALGVDFDKYGYSHYEYMVIDPSNHLADNVYSEAPASGDATAKALASAKADLAAKQSAEATAKKANDAAQAALSTAKAALNAAKANTAAKQKAADQATTDLANANNALTQAQNQLKADQATQASAKAALDNSKQGSSDKSAAIKAAQDKVAAAQKALDNAKANLTAKQDALKKAQADLAAKQKAVSAAEAQLKQDQQALAELQNGKTDPKTVLAQKKADLAKAEDALKTANAKVAAAKAALDKANAAVKPAQDAQKKAQAAYDAAVAEQKEAQKAYDAAKANLWTDAKIYGDQVHVKDVTIHAGEVATVPEITNGFGTQTSVINVPTKGTEGAATLRTWDGKLPAGTQATWADPAQTAADANKVGDHTEVVRIVFPDGSTYDLNTVLHVLANPAKANNGVQSGTTTTLPNGYRVVNGHVVDANGHTVTGWTVANGRVYDAQGHVVANLNATANGNIAAGAKTVNSAVSPVTSANGNADQKQATKALPQTGDARTESAALAALGLVGASILTALGLRKRN